MNDHIFRNLDLDNFWEDGEYALRAYVGDIATDKMFQSAEAYLGYKLPDSYIEMMKKHNGGIPKNCCYPTRTPTSWSESHVAITGIWGADISKQRSLYTSKLYIEEWGYPDIGIYICDCPSAGHDLILLDYSNCGNDGEPEVVHIDQEIGYAKTFLAKDFETFIRGLVNEEMFDTSGDDMVNSLETFKSGRFSDILESYFEKDKTLDFDKILRNMFTELTLEKGYFALHGDDLSHLAYAIQFYLLSINRKINSRAEFIKYYPEMVAMGNHEISVGGYADFYLDWFDARVKLKDISKGLLSGYRFTDSYKQRVFEEMKKFL